MRAPRAARFYFLIYPIRSLFCDVVVAVALVLAETFFSVVSMLKLIFFQLNFSFLLVLCTLPYIRVHKNINYTIYDVSS